MPPESQAHLVDQIALTMQDVPVFEVVVAHDASLTVTSDDVEVYVHAAGSEEVRFHAPIVERISGRTRAAEVVADLNRRHPRLKFLLVEDRVHVAVSVDAQPFVPQHAINAVDRVVRFAAGIDHSFADNLGGVPAARTGHDSHDDEVPPQLMTLLQIDAESGGAVGPQDVLSVCGADRPKITMYAHFCREQAEAWREHAREATDLGRAEDAREHEAEAAPWDRVVCALQETLATARFFDNA